MTEPNPDGPAAEADLDSVIMADLDAAHAAALKEGERALFGDLDNFRPTGLLNNAGGDAGQ